MSVPLTFSCDLVEESKRHIQFLRALHELGTTLEPTNDDSLVRYTDYWLPLVNKHTSDGSSFALVPPPDVAWLWHCHRLAPLKYETYCNHRFGRILEPHPAFVFEQPSSSSSSSDSYTRRLWETMFSDENFFLVKTNVLEEQKPKLQQNVHDFFGFDLLGSTARQATFLWQVSGPKFMDDDFLKDGVVNYRRFLGLSASKSNTASFLLVPTFQIDLMWHTHMLVSTSQYNQDCLQIRGARFHHDDSMTDRSPGAELDLSFRQTAELWQQTYGENYIVPGAMYRGEPPESFYDRNWTSASCSTEHCQCHCEPSVSPVVLVGGSFSSGKDSNLPWVPARAKSKTSDRKPAFIAAYPGHGNKANPPKDGYIFGSESAGVGYYSLETREAYEILLIRLNKQLQYYQNRIQNFDCNNCLCCGCKPSIAQVRAMEQLETEAKEVEDLYNYVKKRAKASGPYSYVGELPKKIPSRASTESDDKNANKNQNLQDYENVLFVPFAALLLAGGCGGGSPGGGCGGGACGGGGCCCDAGGGGGGGCGGCGGCDC